jgi:hypothetical protein
MPEQRLAGTLLRAHLDILIERVLHCFLRAGRFEDISPASHLHLAERYGWLAEFHRRRGETAASERYSRRAARHFAFGRDDEPPPAVAGSLTRPS